MSICMLTKTPNCTSEAKASQEIVFHKSNFFCEDQSQFVCLLWKAASPEKKNLWVRDEYCFSSVVGSGAASFCTAADRL